MLKKVFFLFVVFMLSVSYSYGKMKDLSKKQLQDFVSNESICYEKIVKQCDEEDKPEAVQEKNKNKVREQLDDYEEAIENMKYTTDVTPPSDIAVPDMATVPPSVVYINGANDVRVSFEPQQ